VEKQKKRKFLSSHLGLAKVFNCGGICLQKEGKNKSTSLAISFQLKNENVNSLFVYGKGMKNGSK
jgi:hypothetical protein